MAETPLRVTHVIPQIGIGGAEMQLCQLVSRTPARRAAHRVLYYSDSLDVQGFEVYGRAGVSLHRVDRGPVASPLFLARLAAAVAAGRPDIVHCWLASGAFWGRWAAVFSRAPHIVLAIRSKEIALAPLLRLSRLTDGRQVRYLVNSSASANAVAREIGAPRAAIRVIPNGIDLAASAPDDAREDLLKTYACPAGTRIVLTVGRLTDLKDYPMFLRIVARCRGRLPVRFFVAGHGELEASVKEAARTLGVADVIHFLGLRQDVPSLLKAADLFVYTSRSEGFPNAVLEAMAARRPIVTSRFEGSEDLFESDRGARLVDQGDDAGAFEAIQTLLADPAAAAALGAQARDIAERKFSMERMVESTLEYYEQVVRGLA